MASPEAIEEAKQHVLYIRMTHNILPITADVFNWAIPPAGQSDWDVRCITSNMTIRGVSMESVSQPAKLVWVMVSGDQAGLYRQVDRKCLAESDLNDIRTSIPQQAYIDAEGESSSGHKVAV